MNTLCMGRKTTSRTPYACHVILRNTRRASREREFLELRILHERQHLVLLNVGLSPNTNASSGLFRRPTHSHCARIFAPCSHMYSTKFAITYSRARGDPVRSGFKHLAKWTGSMRIQSRLVQCAFSVDATNVHSISSVDRPLVP